MAKNDTAHRSYQNVAWFYETTTHLYSLGRIRAANASQVAYMGPGDRVLYVGSGTGVDAVLAARSGAIVTCIDLAPAMLERARRRFDAAGLDAEFIQTDVMEFRPEVRYDAVTANFFLDLFTEPVAERVVAKLADLVRPGGRVMMADFAPPEGGMAARAIQFAYAGLANLSFWTIRLAPLQPIHDLRGLLPGAGLELVATDDFRLFSFGPPAYRSLIALRG
jgi:ubiquinone/menaquinone biosynthesis C-methylase UbiE